MLKSQTRAAIQMGDFDKQSLADGVWLALCMGWSAEKSPDAEEVPSIAPAAPEPKVDLETKQPSPVTSEPLIASGEEGYSPIRAGDPQPSPEKAETRKWIGALPSLPDKRGFQRAMRAFATHGPQKLKEIDESETIDRWSKDVSGALVPLFQKGPRRWLKVCLVVETAGSNALWSQPLAELESLMRKRGVFRAVTRKTLCAEARAYKWWKDEIIIVASDFTSDGWREGDYPRLLRKWANSQPLVFMHCLPERLWRRTWTGKADASLWVSWPGQATGSMNLKLDPEAFEFEKPASRLAFPLIRMQAQSFGQWAASLMQSSAKCMPAIVLAVRQQSLVTNQGQAGKRKPEQLVMSFKGAASPLARKLAQYMAVTAPLNFPVMRYVQQSLLPESDSSHLAEFFLGGLLEQTAGDQQTPADQVRYDFIEGVRPCLQSGLRISHGLEVMQTVGRYLEAHDDSGQPWRMWIESDHSERMDLSAEPRAFALVSRAYLERIGLRDGNQRYMPAGESAESTKAASQAGGNVDSIEATTQAGGKGTSVDRIRMLHLSNFYFSEKTSWAAGSILDGLAVKVAELQAQGAIQLVFVTGDIAQSGKAAEYRQATDWFQNKLRPALGGEAFPLENFLFVPGNHDVDTGLQREAFQRQRANAARRSRGRVDALAACFIGEESRIFRERHGAYLDFVAGFCESAKGEAWWHGFLELGALKLGVAGICSSWLCDGEADRGKLALGPFQLRQVLEPIQSADLRIALLHHPLNELIETQTEQAESLLSQGVQLVLRGHRDKAVEMRSSQGKSLWLAASSSHSGHESSFQLLEWTPGNGELTLMPFVTRNRAWLWDRAHFPKSPKGLGSWKLTEDLEMGTGATFGENARPAVFRKTPLPVGALELHVNVEGDVRVEGENFIREFRLKKSELWIQDSIPVGDYRVRSWQDGYELCEKAVEIERDKRTTLNLVLSKMPAGTRRVLKIGDLEYGMRYCPPAVFLMGSPESEKDRYDDEKQHEVRLTRGFWMGETVVTQAQWRAVMGDNPSHFKGEERPVECVSWEDIERFLKKLRPLCKEEPRLPTEAEWEYACRAGTQTPFHYGERLDATMANFDGNHPYGGAPKGEYRAQTTAVRSFAANAWGLYDMHGNVCEWCADWYGEYPQEATENPIGPSQGADRVLRGGSWSYNGRNCRSADRYSNGPGNRNWHDGFRLATSSSGK